MFSPTGYVATIHVDAWRLDDRKFGHRLVEESRPVLHWNEDGRPVISDEEGNLVTPQQYIAEYLELDEEHRYTGSFEIQGTE
jgi:hypothetical protein